MRAWCVVIAAPIVLHESATLAVMRRCATRYGRFAEMGTKTPSWDDLRMLLAVHRERSFLAAGRVLGLSPSTVARRVEALERSMGRTIVHRGNNGTQLDPDALRLVALAEELELGLASLRRAPRDESLTGTVRLSLSEGFVRPVTTLLARLRVKHPGLMVELVSESRMADIARHEADIGIRIVRSTSDTIVSKSVGRARPAVFASRAYVERRIPGRQLTRAVAAQHDWVGFDSALERMPNEQWLRAYGASRFVFRSNSSAAIEQAVIEGIGLGILVESQGISNRELVRLDTESEPPAVEIFVAYHRDARNTPRVKVVARELEGELRRALA